MKNAKLGPTFSPRPIIEFHKGDILRGIRSDDAVGKYFGELYFSTVNVDRGRMESALSCNLKSNGAFW